SGVRLRAVAAVLPAPGRSAAGRSGHGLAYRLALRPPPPGGGRGTSRSWPLRGRAARATVSPIGSPSGLRLRAVAAVLPAPGRSAAGPLGPRSRLSARPPASASGRWPRYFPLLAAPRPGRSGHGLAYRLALRPPPPGGGRGTSRSWPLRGRAARATVSPIGSPSGLRLRAVAAVLPAPGRSAAGPLGPRSRLSARPPASASGRWPRYFPLLA